MVNALKIAMQHMKDGLKANEEQHTEDGLKANEKGLDDSPELTRQIKGLAK